MVIEWLKFKVSPEKREEFIDKDTQIWTPALARCAGFLGKEVWIDPQDSTIVVFVIRWATRQEWESVPQDLLEKTEQQFTESMDNSYQLIESGEYQVRKFPQLN